LNTIYEDGLTIMTDAHRRVLQWLENRGYEVMEEVPFSPYTVDIYLPDFHAVIEVDGPQHSRAADQKRDLTLNSVYNLLIFHVNAADAYQPTPAARLARDIRQFLDKALLDAEDRLKWVKDRIPWL